jgi:hypothetical protein
METEKTVKKEETTKISKPSEYETKGKTKPPPKKK